MASIDGVLVYNLFPDKKVILISQNSVGQSEEASQKDADAIADAVVQIAGEKSELSVLFAYESLFSSCDQHLSARMDELQKAKEPANLRVERKLDRYKNIVTSAWSDSVKALHLQPMTSEIAEIAMQSKADKVVLSLSAVNFKELDRIIKEENASYVRMSLDPENYFASLFSGTLLNDVSMDLYFPRPDNS